MGQGILIAEATPSYSDTPHLTKHNTHKRETSMTRWDSNLRRQTAICRRPTSYCV